MTQPADVPGAQPPPSPGGGDQAGPPATPDNPQATGAPQTGAQADAGPSRAGKTTYVAKTLHDTGSVSARQQMSQAAQRSLSVDRLGIYAAAGVHAEGDLIGLQVNMATEQTLLPGRLPDAVYLSVKEAFVGDEKDLITAVEQLGAVPTLVVCDQPGRGRLARAVRVLQLMEHATIRVVRAVKDLKDNVVEGTGYIYMPADSGVVDMRELDSLGVQLSHAGARLILILPPERITVELLEIQIQLPPGPSAMDVLRRHLSWRLAEESAAATTVVQSMMADFVADDAPLRHAADLAQWIFEARSDNGYDYESVRARVDERTRTAFEIWFDQLDRESQVFAIALAVLNDLPYEYVVDAARSLRRRVMPPITVLNAGSEGNEIAVRAPADTFQISRRERLTRLHAIVERKDVRGEYGMAPADVIRYRNPAYAPQIIQRAWSQYAAQAQLLDWLRELAVHPAEPVRVWAATAIGILTAESFDYLCETALETWALSKSMYARSAVAHALHVPASDPRLRPHVRKLAATWADAAAMTEATDLTDDDFEVDRLAQATAARIYGVTLGRDEPDESLSALRRLAEIDDIRVALAVGESLAELLLDRPERAEPILANVLSWLDEDADNEDLAATAHLAFLILATSLVVEVPRAEGAADAFSWPMLLHLAAEKPALGFGIARIWHYAMSTTRYFPEQADLVLAQWLRQVADDQRAWSPLATLASQICFDDLGLHQHLLTLVETWITDGTLTPSNAAAAAVRDKLISQR
ncbi:hypothetical protein [Hamadaea tsunoensis]|uniref:hypothetical protein n=1 Tax=Hamadaea tsunoensis TaxID=53368 RepID=UPI00040D4DA8|nr:hypothetical protein [Hamadaea tsunoensis]